MYTAMLLSLLCLSCMTAGHINHYLESGVEHITISQVRELVITHANS